MVSGTASAAVRGDVNSKSLAYIAADSLGSVMGRRMGEARAERKAAQSGYDAVWADGNPFNDGNADTALSGAPDMDVGLVERERIPLELRPIDADVAGRATFQSVRTSGGSGIGAPIALGGGAADEVFHEDTPEQQSWVKQVFDYARKAGVAVPDRSDYASVKSYYEAGYKNPVNMEPVQVSAGEPDAFSWGAYHNLQDGVGIGVYKPEVLASIGKRLGYLPMSAVQQSELTQQRLIAADKQWAADGRMLFKMFGGTIGAIGMPLYEGNYKEAGINAAIEVAGFGVAKLGGMAWRALRGANEFKSTVQISEEFAVDAVDEMGTFTATGSEVFHGPGVTRCGPAQELSNLLRVPVKGATAPVGVPRIPSSVPEVRQGGEWIDFFPEGGVW